MYWKKNQPHSSIISEVVDSERCACLNALQGLFLKPFRSEPVNETQKLLGSAEKNFYPTSLSFWAKLSEKKLFLIGCEILSLPQNTLIANYEYSRINRENLPLPT